MIQQLTYQQTLSLLQLRTVIARAAQKDSLKWWEDESLTENGGYLLERIFPGAPHVTGRNLAIEAATVRHNAALRDFDHTLHLFRLDSANSDYLAMRELRHHFEEGVSAFSAPITNMDTMHQHLLAIIGAPPRYETVGLRSDQNAMRIALRVPSTDIVERANALAWTYLEGEIGKPVFPYFIERNE